jgi:uncharacterized membrane protein
MVSYDFIHLVVRWLHVIAGITWIGHLYFFNFVNVPLQGVLDDATKKSVNPQLIPRALWWFRWGAMITFLAGLLLFVMNYMYTPGIGFGATPYMMDAEGITGRAIWIMMGMTFGIIMWFNVWMIIWPAQRRIFGIGVPKATPEQLPAIRKRAGLFSRINTYLSGPMLFGMLAPAHYGQANGTVLLVSIGLGLFAIWWSIKSSYGVGKIA